MEVEVKLTPQLDQPPAIVNEHRLSDLVVMEALLVWRCELAPEDEQEVLPGHRLVRAPRRRAVWAGDVLPFLLLDVEAV